MPLSTFIVIISLPLTTFHCCVGFSITQAFVNNGIRWSTAHAYLRPAMERANLDVAVRTPVAKVILVYSSLLLECL